MAGFGRDKQLRIENFWLWTIRTTFVLCSQYVLFMRPPSAPSPTVKMVSGPFTLGPAARFGSRFEIDQACRPRPTHSAAMARQDWMHLLSLATTLAMAAVAIWILLFAM